MSVPAPDGTTMNEPLRNGERRVASLALALAATFCLAVASGTVPLACNAWSASARAARITSHVLAAGVARLELGAGPALAASASRWPAR